jgi:hypothetical protein
MVAIDGVLSVPCRISVKLNPDDTAAEGGTKVKDAKSKWMIDRNVGGI